MILTSGSEDMGSLEEKLHSMNTQISQVMEMFKEAPTCELPYDHVCSTCKVRKNNYFFPPIFLFIYINFYIGANILEESRFVL